LEDIKEATSIQVNSVRLALQCEDNLNSVKLIRCYYDNGLRFFIPSEGPIQRKEFSSKAYLIFCYHSLSVGEIDKCLKEFIGRWRRNR
jgi:hypothetical protein